MVWKNVLLANVALFTGYQLGVNWEEKNSIDQKKKQKTYERETFEKRIEPYREWIAPKPDPHWEKVKPKNAMLDICAQSDTVFCTMDLAAAQGRLNLIRSDEFLIEDYDERRPPSKGLDDYRDLYRDNMWVGRSWRAPVAAARFGHLEVLKWFEPQWQYHVPEVIDAANQGGHEHILSYVREKFPEKF